MKLTESLYKILCQKYKERIDNGEKLIVQYVQDLVDNPDINNSSAIVEEIYNISDARDKLEALKDFWIHNKNL